MSTSCAFGGSGFGPHSRVSVKIHGPHLRVIELLWTNQGPWTASLRRELREDVWLSSSQKLCNFRPEWPP